MNEVENHYAGHGEHEPGSSGIEPGRAGPAGAAKAVLDGPTSKAKGAIKDASAKVSTARDGAGRVYGQVSDWAQDQYGAAADKAGDVRRRSASEFARRREGVETLIEENPVMLAVAGFAAGLLVGSLLPGTKPENRLFGRYADEVKDQGWRYAQDLAEQGKQFVEESLDASKRTGAPDEEQRRT